MDSPTSESPPANTFKNLAMVDEVEAKQVAAGAPHLSKSQRKKLRRAARSEVSQPIPPTS